jgi:hypothetical protein
MRLTTCSRQPDRRATKAAVPEEAAVVAAVVVVAAAPGVAEAARVAVAQAAAAGETALVVAVLAEAIAGYQIFPDYPDYQICRNFRRCRIFRGFNFPMLARNMSNGCMIDALRCNGTCLPQAYS